MPAKLSTTRLFVARPQDLEDLADVLDAVQRAVSSACRRLEGDTATTRFSDTASSTAGDRLRSRCNRAVGGVARVGPSMAQTASEVRRAAHDAALADVAEVDLTIQQQILWWAGHRSARAWQRTARSVLLTGRLASDFARSPSQWGDEETFDQEGNRHGDLGETYTSRPVGRWSASSGRRTVSRALAMTGDGTMFGPDEFGLVTHNVDGPPGSHPGRFTVVLPGVVDLSRPQPGLDPRHRSVRDLDMAAAPSAAIGGAADPYAAMVAEALKQQGVPDNAAVNLVGHSYGAAAAMALAQSPTFNRRYNVRAVVAAGYYLDGDADSYRPLRPDTQSAVLMNDNDVVVMAEGLLLEQSVAPILAPLRGPIQARADVVRFDGGRSLFGHDPAHYADFVDEAEAETLLGLTERLEAEGFDQPGTVTAVDISVPETGGIPIHLASPAAAD